MKKERSAGNLFRLVAMGGIIFGCAMILVGELMTC